MPAEFFSDPELLATSIPAHRADFEIAETYRSRERAPLGIPITVLGGAADQLTADELGAWSRHTTAGSELRLLPGDHFYLREQRRELLALVDQRLRAA
jgi:surfactin synthase thioesterase subunit